MAQLRAGTLLAGGLFAASAVLAAVIGWLTLAACGVAIPGAGLLVNACEVPSAPPPPDPGDAERLRGEALARELAQMERRLSLAPSCPPVAVAPPPPVPPPAAPPPVPPVAEAPPPPPPPPRPATPPPPAPPPPPAQVCGVKRTDSVVLLLDISKSMQLSYDVPADLERRFYELGETMRGGSVLERIMTAPMARALEQQMDAVPGPRRIVLAKDALSALVDAASRDVAFDFVTFSRCGPPQHRGHYPTDRRPELKQAIRNTALDDSTSLAEAIRALPSLVARRSPAAGQAINVVLVSDGFDSCGGDPCAAASAVERQRPDIDINVVAVSRAIDALSCISRNTGGKFFQPRDTSQVAQLLARAAGQGSPDQCH